VCASEIHKLYFNERKVVMPLITLHDGTQIKATEGQRLVLALEDGGVDILHRCGGHARCTTCRVQFVEGEPRQITLAERERRNAAFLPDGVRLSCQILCDHDMTLQVIYRVSNGDAEDAGHRPEVEITPEPQWVNQ
jgi:ferredoxin